MLVVVVEGGGSGFRLLGGSHAVDGKKEFGNEWEVDGSKVEALLR
jgi:hypothetical protein